MTSRRKTLDLIVTWGIIGLALLFFLMPVAWMILTSFKDRGEYFSFPPVFIPGNFDLENYEAVLFPHGMRAIRDSLVVAGVSTLIALAAGLPTAYSLARFRVGGENFAFWILSIRMFPPVVAALPLFLLFREFRLLDTYWALYLAYLTFNLPFVVWLMKGFFEDLPIELEEAALVDGANRFQTFLRIAFPLTMPGMVATGLLAFIFAWNEFLLALFLTRSRVRTLPILIAGLEGGHEVLWGQISAIGVIAILPTIAMALFLQRYLVRGLTLGAVKG